MVSCIFRKRNIAIFITLCICMMFILAPSRYMTVTLDSLKIFATNVLPCIFPFMFFTTLLTYLGLPKDLAIFTAPLYKVYHTSYHSGYILIMSMLCGYPIGSKLISDAYSNHLITKKEVSKISAFTSFASPIFVIGTCGACFLNNKYYGYIIYFSHVIGTLINGLLYRSNSNCINVHVSENVTDTVSNGMNKAILNAFAVGGFIIIVNVLIQFIDDLGIFTLTTIIFGNNDFSAITNGTIKGLFEMTGGIIYLSQLHISEKIIIPLTTFIISFGGLSILLQTVTTLSNTEVKTRKILLTKFTQAILSTLICIPLVFILC